MSGWSLRTFSGVPESFTDVRLRERSIERYELFTSLNLKIGDTSATKEERDMVTWRIIVAMSNQEEVTEPTRPAS